VNCTAPAHLVTPVLPGASLPKHLQPTKRPPSYVSVSSEHLISNQVVALGCLWMGVPKVADSATLGAR
jgi:hypothetical protein